MSNENEWELLRDPGLLSGLLYFPAKGYREIPPGSLSLWSLCSCALGRLELCALLGWLGGGRWLQWLGARGRFDRVQGFAKPRVFCSLDFIHKRSSLMFQFLIKKRKSSELCVFSLPKNPRCIVLWNPQLCIAAAVLPQNSWEILTGFLMQCFWSKFRFRLQHVWNNKYMDGQNFCWCCKHDWILVPNTWPSPQEHPGPAQKPFRVTRGAMVRAMAGYGGRQGLWEKGKGE